MALPVSLCALDKVSMCLEGQVYTWRYLHTCQGEGRRDTTSTFGCFVSPLT